MGNLRKLMVSMCGSGLLFCLLGTVAGPSAYGQRVYAPEETSGKTGGAKIDKPEDAADSGDLNNSSKLEIDGLFESAYQILWFGQTVKQNTPVTVKLRYKTDVSVLAGISIEPMMNQNTVPGAFRQNTPLTLLGSEDEEVLTLVPGGDYNGIRIRLSGVLGKSKVEIYYAYYLADPAIKVIPDPVCQGEMAQLQVLNPVPGHEFRLYTSETAATPLITNNTGIFITPPVNAETTFYAEAAEVPGNAGVSARIPVVVRISPRPLLAAIPNQHLCEGGSLDLRTLNPADQNGSINGTYIWSLSAGGPPLLTTAINPFVGSATYWVNYTVNGCSDSRSVTITTTRKPAPITISVSKN